jgi:hypothetical protein
MVTLLNNSATTDSIPPRASANNLTNPFVLLVDSLCPIGHEVEFIVTTNQGGFVRDQDVSLIVGEPEILFQDDAEAGMGNWTVSLGWGLCNISPHAGIYSFAESPIGNYPNNTTRIMTLTQPLNLTIATSLWLEFWTRWDIEANYDFGQVEVSTDGVNWTPVAGLYTVPGSGIGVQPTGQPGYEGTQATWVKEYMNLDPLAGVPYFKFRFEFKSDGGVVGDGWFVDDIKLMGFTGAGTPPDVSLTLSPVNPPIIIQPGGGSFSFTVNVVNNETSSVACDFWTNLLLPNGSTYGPILLRTGINLPPGANILRTLTQSIPASAPAGEYLYRGYLGLYPNTTYDDDNFPFTKLP